MDNKKILGLDIGTNSIGWAIVEASSEKPIKYNKYFNDDSPETKTDTNNQRERIHTGKDGLPAVGVRIISQEGKMLTRFNEGKKLNEKKNETPTAQRRRIRGGRKLKSRYKLRRDKLCTVLEILGMLPDGSFKKVINKNGKEIWKPIEDKNGKWYTKKREYEYDEIGKKKKKRKNEEGIITGIGEDLYKLRSNASKNPLEDKKDWGRILLHLNQWRGYSSDRYSNNEDDEQADDGYYTSLVKNAEEIKRIFKDRQNKRLDKIHYQISFENGDVGIDIVKVGEDSFYSKFRKNEVSTYKKHIDENDKSILYVTWQNLKKEAWAYRKWLINDGIEKYIASNAGTVGSYFYDNFFNQDFLKTIPEDKRLKRIRHNVVNREWYEKEFEIIWKIQFEKHKEYFTSELIDKCIDASFTKDENIKKELRKISEAELRLKALIKDKIIYYQRPWQQTKNKGECRFEKIPDIKKDKDGKIIPHKDGKEHWKGRAVIPRSHPLHQEYKIWQQINNVRIWFHPVDKKEIELLDHETLCKEKLQKTPIEIKALLYKRLQEKKVQSWRTFVNELFPDIEIKLKKADETKNATETEHFSVNFIKLSKKGDEQDNLLKGNKTKVQIEEILQKRNNGWYDENHVSTNKKREEKIKDIPKSESCKTPISNLQLLWECIYDLTGFQAGNDNANIEMIAKKIRNHFNEDIISDIQCNSLAKIKLDDAGLGQLSARAIHKLLPLMSIEEYATQYPLPKKVKEQIDALIKINQEEQNETNDDLKLYSLKEFITDKNARIKLSSKMSENEFRGLNYWEAAAVVYGNHSKAGVTNIPANKIKERVKNMLPVLPGKMNNPIVEKIVNETIKMVQLIYEIYDGFDEVRIELSRELKNSREDREAIWDAMNNNNKRNDWAKKMLREMFNENEEANIDNSFSNGNIDKIKIIEDVVANRKGKAHEEKRKKVVAEPTKSEILKYRLWLQQEFRCPYTDSIIPFSDVFAKQKKVEIEHIIPKQRYPDNSYSNKVVTWVEVNAAKSLLGNRTAYEFIVSKRDVDYVIVGNERKNLIAKEKWGEKVKEMYKGRKAKNLLRKDIPEDPINRELKDTQYINKKLREKIGEAIGMEKVWTTTGQVTDTLRKVWHLNEKVMLELVKERYQKFQVNFGSGAIPLENANTIFDNQVWNKVTEEYEPRKEYPNFSKRLDHRHHALDAIIVACTKQQHIQYLNTLNAQFELTELEDEDEKEIAKKKKYKALQNLIYEIVADEQGKKHKSFFTPWEAEEFIPQVKDALSKIIVSHKNSNVLTSPSKNKQIDKDKYTSISIRQGLHKETLIGKRKLYNNKLTSITEIIERIFSEKRNNEKQFAEIIKDIVFKETFQRELISLFEKYSSIKEIDKLRTKVLYEINNNQILNFEGATTFDLVPIKRGTETIDKVNVNNVVDYRTQRYLGYKNGLLESLDKKIKEEKNDDTKKELQKKKKRFLETPIYYNALYDVRVHDGKGIYGENKNWFPLFMFEFSKLEEIEYVKNNKGKKVINHNRTEQIKKIIKDYQFEFTKENILIEQPIIVGASKIEIKKATVNSSFGNSKTKKKEYDEDGNEIKDDVLIEIRPKTFVVLESKFRAIITVDNTTKKRSVGFIEFKEALDYQKLKRDFIQAEIKIPNKLIPENQKLLFTLSKNDLVLLPDNITDVIDWNNVTSLSNKLYKVLDFDSTGLIRVVKHTIASPIEIKDKMDATGLKNEIDILSKKLEEEKINYEQEKTKIDKKIEEFKIWEKGLNKKDSAFNAEEINIKELEIKNDKNLLKEHLKEIEDLKKSMVNLSKKIEFNSKPDKKGNIKEAEPIQEAFEIKSKENIQKVIKVFTDKLGKKVVPYWEFKNKEGIPNGCWNKKDAKRLGLIIQNELNNNF